MFKIKDAWQIVEEVSTEGTWTDVRDGQVYPYKQIGNQIWMTVNLNYGGKQGDWVPNTTAQSAGHAWRYRDEQNYNSFPFERGALYRFTSLDWAVPEGWHIPTVDEFDTLFAYLDSEYGNHVASAKMNTNYWAQGVSGTNDSGLTLIPTGMLQQGYWSYCDRTPSNPGGTNMGVYWTATDYSSVARRITNVASSIYYGNSTKTDKSAYAIRLIKDSGVYVPQPAISTIVTSLDSTGSDNKIPTEKATRSAITSAVSSKMSNPMTSAGDIIVGGTSGEATVLTMGSQGQVLTVGVSGLEWANGSSGGDLPITTKGDMVIGDEDGNAIRMPIGTSGQTLMVNSSGTIEYCDIFSRSSVTSGDTIGTYSSSASKNNFLDIRGKYGYNTQNAESITNSGVRLSLNESLFRVNTHGFDLGAPYRIDWLGCGIRYRKTASRKSILLFGDTGYSTTSAYSVIGKALAIGTDNDNIYIGAYNNSNRATSALNSFNPYNLMSYTNASSYGGRIGFMFPCNPGPVPEWSGASYNSARSYLSLCRGSETNNPSGMFEICSSATNKYGDTRAKCDTVAFRVKSGWSIFQDKIMFRATSCTTAPIYARKIVTGRTWPNDVIPVSQQQADGGVVYGYGETSARDSLTTYGKDPGRQYYTTDDNRVNVYNNTTSGWDKIAYLSDVGGGGGGIVAELGTPFHSSYYDDSDVLSYLYMFFPQSLTISGGFILPIVESLADPSNISVFSAAIYESDTDIYSATKLVETNTFVGTPTLDKKLRFEFTPTSLDANKSYWLMLSIKGLAAVPGGNLRLRSFPVDNSNLDTDALSCAVTYDDAAPSLSDFLDYSYTPNGMAPYVRLE